MNLIKSIEYNDNRISKYAGQQGKCFVTNQELQIGKMHCHHIVPLEKGGTDKYENLVFVNDDIHRLIHATKENTISEYLIKLKLDSNQMKKLNKLRTSAGLETIKEVSLKNIIT